MKQQNEGQFPMGSVQDSYNWMTAFLFAWATCYWPFFRCDFGTEGIGFSGLLGMLLLLAYASAERSGAMLCYFAVWMVLVAWHRLTALVRERRGGRVQHSRYDGWPFIVLRLMPFIKREGTAKGVEALLCPIIGCLVMPASPALGGFLMGGLLAVGGVEATKNQLRRNRLRRMRDAEIELQQLTQQYRRGGRF